MSIFTFINQDELDDLPEDPSMAFMTFVQHAQRRLSEETKQFDPDDQYQWQQLEELRHSFMNVILAAAKRFEIEPFTSMEVPTLSNFRDIDHRQFRADLDHFVTQLMLDNSLRNKRDSVEILPKSKDRIRAYVHNLRTCIEQSNMTDAKRESLLKRLDQFEAELEKRRLSLLALTHITLNLLAIPGGLWASGDVAHRLITSVMQIVAEAKAAEEETRQLPPTTPPKALSPPRRPVSDSRPQPAFDTDLDDDVPF